jgi:hypothetical protein
MIRKQSGRPRGTHPLKNADGETTQSMETIRASEGYSLSGERRRRGNSETETIRASKGHSLSGERRQRDKSGYGTIQVSEAFSLAGERRQRAPSEYGSNRSERGALTDWRAPTEEQVRTRKQSEQAKGAHQLESADGGTSQNMQTIRASERDSLAGERRQRDKLGYGNKPSEQEALTN